MHEKPKKHILRNISKILCPHESAKTDIVAEAEQIIENYLCKMGYKKPRKNPIPFMAWLFLGAAFACAVCAFIMYAFE